MSTPKTMPLKGAVRTALLKLGLIAAAPVPRNPVVTASYKRDTIAPLLGVSPRTIQSWADESSTPQGVSLLVLLYLINVAGIEVTEYPSEQVTDTLHMLREVLVFDLASTKKLAEEAGYNHPHSVLSALFVRNGIMPKRVDELEKVAEKYAEQLATKRAVVENAIRKIYPHAKFRSVSTDWTIASGLQLPQVSTDPTQPLNDAEFALIAPALMQLLPLAERLAQDSSPRGIQLRQKLRQQTAAPPTTAVFRLSTAFNALCGEKARNEPR